MCSCSVWDATTKPEPIRALYATGRLLPTPPSRAAMTGRGGRGVKAESTHAPPAINMCVAPAVIPSPGEKKSFI